MAKDGKQDLKKAAIDTIAVHAGEGADPTTRAHNLPIYQTATFTFETADEKEEAVDGALAWEPNRYFYTRTNNPTTAALEEKLAALEGAESAIASASGMSAISAGLLAHLKSGDHLIVADDLFIISQILFAEDFPSRGIDVTPVEITNLEAVKAAMRPNTRIIFAEVLSNPWMRISDAQLSSARTSCCRPPPSGSLDTVMRLAALPQGVRRSWIRSGDRPIFLAVPPHRSTPGSLREVRAPSRYE